MIDAILIYLPPMKINFIRFCKVLFILLLINLVSVAQNKENSFHISGRVRVDNGDPTGAVVTLTNPATQQTEKSATINSTGKFELDLSYSSEYKLTVAKENHYTKDIDVSTMIPSTVWIKDSIFPPFLMVVTIYKKVPFAIMSFEGKTVGKISYSPKGKLDNFDSFVFIDDRDIRKEIDQALKDHEDEIFNQKMAEAVEFEKKNQIREAIKTYEEALALRKNDPFIKPKLKELSSDLKGMDKEAMLEADFSRLVASGDANILIMKYPEGISNFKSALDIKPGNQIVLDKISNAEQLLAKLNAEKAKLEAEFNRLIAAGDLNVTEKEYPNAIGNFKNALTLKPGDRVATTKLANATQLLANFNADKANQEAEFNRLLTAGDANVLGQKYPEAIENFKGALNLKVGDKIATDKLANAEGLLAKLNADKAKMEAEFTRLLAAGDDNVVNAKYPEGITNFKDALKIKAGDPVATARLANAEQLLALFLAEKLKKEKELKLLADKQKKYKETILWADQLFAGKTYPEAKNQYLEAIKISDTEQYPKDKISEIDAILAKQSADKLLAQRQAEELRKLQGEGSYLNNIKTGDANFAKSLWTVAIFYYQEALKFKASDKYAMEKIDNCKKMIDSNITAERMLEYTSFIKHADDDLEGKRYSSARFYYGKAVDILPWENYPKGQLIVVEKLISTSDLSGTDAQYIDAIKKAEEAVIQKNIAIARFYFQKAISLKPEEEYPKEQLKRLSSGL